jgi:hypothetical protein
MPLLHLPEDIDMLPLGLSSLELRNIIERAFLPLRCQCDCSEDGTFFVQISDPGTGLVALTQRGIAPERLASSRAISQLIGELRGQLHSSAEPLPVARRQARLG